jgi:hypothetical protein
MVGEKEQYLQEVICSRVSSNLQMLWLGSRIIHLLFLLGLRRLVHRVVPSVEK